MKIPIYQIDSFTTELFKGNPAAVCHLPHWLSDEILQNIAIENNLAETGFFVQKGDRYEIRWFMPHGEIDLCGHATLASAYVIFGFIHRDWNQVEFESKSGILSAKKETDGSITLDFPSRPPKQIEMPSEIFKAFKGTPLKAFASRDLIITYSSEENIINQQPNIEVLKSLSYTCIAITAKGNKADFVSRVFDSEADMPEDPVTGSTHASLAPLWANILGKQQMVAEQLSKRGGKIFCKLEGDRVHLGGFAVLYMTGTIEVN